MKAIAAFASAILFVKVLLEILFEYRWYFPADFDAAFLSGRRDSFVGVYWAAFYTHILSGPVAVVLGAVLMISGGRARYGSLHRRAGQFQMAVVFGAVVPSGLVMASQAFAGPIAGFGFAALSLATAVSAGVALRCALARRYSAHQRWAGRCFVLLCSPLLLRLVSGAAIVLQRESEWMYRLNAWLSWLIPLAIYEVWLHFSESSRSRPSLHENAFPLEVPPVFFKPFDKAFAPKETKGATYECADEYGITGEEWRLVK